MFVLFDYLLVVGFRKDPVFGLMRKIVVANVRIIRHVYGEPHEQRRSANTEPRELKNFFEVDILHSVMANVICTAKYYKKT